MINSMSLPFEDEQFLREGLVFTLFSKASLEDATQGLKVIMDAWLAIIPKQELTWYHSTAYEYKPLKKSTISRLRNTLKVERFEEKEVVGFKLFSNPQDNPDYLLDLTCRGQAIDSDDRPNHYIELRFPTEFITDYGVERFVEFCLKMTTLLPYTSGYAALGINGFSGNTDMGFAFIRKHAFHHPGYDISDNMHTSYKFGHHSRGARWLTFLGEKLVAKLEGAEALKAQLDPAITITPAGQGIMIRAGEYPEVGDIEQGDNLPLLRSVAKAIEPVSYFNDGCLESLFDDKYQSEPYQQWERRFLD